MDFSYFIDAHPQCGSYWIELDGNLRPRRGHYLLHITVALRIGLDIQLRFLHKGTSRPNLFPPDNQYDRRKRENQRQEPKQTTSPPETEISIHALRSKGQERREDVLAQRHSRDGAARKLCVSINNIVRKPYDHNRITSPDHSQADSRRHPRQRRIRGPRIHEHAARHADEAGDDARIQPRFRDGRAWVLGVALRGGEVELCGDEGAAPADRLADDDGDLDEAGLNGVPAVQRGEDLLDGLGEEVDVADDQAGHEGADEGDGLGEEHVERPLHASEE